MTVLHIAEILSDDGSLRYRYARKLSSDGSTWVRDGLFQAFHPNGTLASEGSYVEGFEEGEWRDFHDNGQVAAEGAYRRGDEVGSWQFWNADGTISASR